MGHQNGCSCQSQNKQQLLWAIKMGTVASHITYNSYCWLSKWMQLPDTRQTTIIVGYQNALLLDTKQTTIIVHGLSKWAQLLVTRQTNNSYCGLWKWAQLPVTKQTTVVVGYQNGHSCQSQNKQTTVIAGYQTVRIHWLSDCKTNQIV